MLHYSPNISIYEKGICVKSLALYMLFLNLFTIISLHSNTEITTVFGTCTIEEPVLQELIECPSMQRLKHIHQYGIHYYVGTIDYEYSRYEHSLGVFHLIRMFGGSLREQIAGLLHDISHTVFSHVSDHLFKVHGDDSYQDNIHLWFLEQTEIAQILGKYNIKLTEIIHKKNGFSRLEQELPKLCADRIEYNLNGGLKEGMLTHHDIHNVIKHLSFDNDQWIVNDQDAALKLGLTSLYLTEHLFCTKQNFVLYDLAALALDHALSKKIITPKDLHFGTDHEVWHTLRTSQDPYLQRIVHSILNEQDYYHKTYKKDLHTIHAGGKFRGVDPLVKTHNGLQLLTELNITYSHLYTKLQNKIKHGMYIHCTCENAISLQDAIKGH